MNEIIAKGTHGIVSRMADSVFPYQGWPTVAADANGILYVAASGFRAGHVCPFGKIVLYKSVDGGAVWSAPAVVNDSAMDDRDAGIIGLKDGTMLLSWFNRSPREYRTPHYERLLDRIHPYLRDAAYAMTERLDTLREEQRTLGSFIRVCPNGGNWSAATRVPVMAPHGPNVCADGTLIYMGTEHHAQDDLPEGTAGFYVSKDNGATWQRRWMLQPGNWISPHQELCEPHVIELGDGSLLAAFRVDGDGKMTIITTRSTDGGYTWSAPASTGIDGGPPHFCRHTGGALILSYGRRSEPFGQRAAVSYDDGRTWKTEYILEHCPESKDLGYASTVELPDGSLLTVYYQHCPGDAFASILYTKWTLEE